MFLCGCSRTGNPSMDAAPSGLTGGHPWLWLAGAALLGYLVLRKIL